MNVIARIIAPAALAAAAFGVQASEFTPGDLGAQRVQAGAATALQTTTPVGMQGELTPGDLGARPPAAAVATSRVPGDASSRRARPIGPGLVGA
jgi:hypothetical protein